MSKLEKADILELTVQHLHNLRRQNASAARKDQSYAGKFTAGFQHCATEVQQFLQHVNRQQPTVATHLAATIKQLEAQISSALAANKPAIRGNNDCCSSDDENMTDLNTPPSSPYINVDDLPVWRPW